MADIYGCDIDDTDTKNHWSILILILRF